MRLLTLSIASIWACVIGLVALLGIAHHELTQVREKQGEIQQMLALKKRVDDFSVASDSLLLFETQPSLWRAFTAEARALQEQLRELATRHPHAGKGVRHIGAIVATLERHSASDVATTQAEPGAPRPGSGPLDIPLRSRIVMHQIASHGVALDTALDHVLRERQAVIAREAMWIFGGLAAAAVVFGMLCVLAFGLIHRRVAVPARAVTDTLERIRAGDPHARAPITGNDELSRVAQTLNRTLDERDAADVRLREQQAELEQRAQMLAESQRIARIGSWRRYVADERLEWSDETYRICGVSPERFTPSPRAFLELVHPDDRERLRRERDQALAGRDAADIEVRIVRPDGELRHVHILTELGRDAAGNVAMYGGTIQDITERKRLEERLQHFHELIEGSEDLCAIIDSDYRYLWVNHAHADNYELENRQIEGHPVRQIVGADFFDQTVKPRLDRCLAGQPQRFETEQEYPGPGRRQLLARYYPIEVAGESARCVGAVLTDVTEVRAAEAALNEQARLLDMAGHAARFGAWTVDLASGRVKWSDTVAEIHGMPPGYAPTSEQAIAWCAPEYREHIRALFSGCAERGEPYDTELQIIDADGRRVWVHTVGEAVRDEQGAIIRVQGAFQDISARKEAEDESQRLHRRLSTIFESITDGFYALDHDWRFSYLNNEAERLVGRPREELLGRVVWEEFPEVVGSVLEHNYRRALKDGVTVALEHYNPQLETWFDIRAYPSPEGLAVYFRDVSERHAMIERLQEQEDGLRRSRDRLAELLTTRKALIDSLPAHIALLDPEGSILDVNDQWRQFGRDNAYAGDTFGVGESYLRVCDTAAGDSAEQATEVAAGLRAVLAGERDSFALEYPCHAPGERCWFRVTGNRLTADADAQGTHGIVVMHVDITERRLAEEELNRLAYEDPLTGLASRHGFEVALGQVLERGWQREGVIVMLNVQRMRDVNDAHGYAVGDQLLAQVGERLREAAGEHAVLGRTGADEFVAFLPQRSPSRPARELDRLDSIFARPFELDSAMLEVSACFGYTRLGDTPRAVETLLREAALALYQCRTREGGHGWVAYTEAFEQEANQRIVVTRELHEALRNTEFELHFQPKVELASGALVSCEALLRWNHPERGLQSPATFIPIAERSQLIAPIGDWVVNEACRLARQWQDEGLDVVRVAVNVSLVQFMVGDFNETVRQALATHGMAAGSLTLEITESVFERESEALRARLRGLHDMGVRLSLDDFGTGYSSLLYLQSYPFDEIKVDQGFVRHMTEDDYSRDIVRTVLGVAGALGADAVAEGVETAAEREALLELGCVLGQGYYFSMPLAAEDFRWLLAKRSPLPLQQTRAAGG